MKKMLTAAAIATAALAYPTLGFAQDRAVPAGDALAQTPPADVTRQELQASPPQDRTPAKLQELQGQPGVAPMAPKP